MPGWERAARVELEGWAADVLLADRAGSTAGGNRRARSFP